MISERENWIQLIRDEYDSRPDLGLGSYPAFDSEWDDGVGRIADAILADQGLLLLKHAEAATLFREVVRMVKDAFGAPGDYGYETKQGKALYELYKLVLHEIYKSRSAL